MTIQQMSDNELIEFYKLKKSSRVGKLVDSGKLYDTKHAYHLVRLASQCEEILTTGNLTLDKKDRREYLKAIRRGEVKQKDVEDWFNSKDKQLDELYHSSDLQHSPNEEEIKQLLLDVLHTQYGNMEDAIKITTPAELIVEKIKDILQQYGD